MSEHPHGRGFAPARRPVPGNGPPITYHEFLAASENGVNPTASLGWYNTPDQTPIAAPTSPYPQSPSVPPPPTPTYYSPPQQQHYSPAVEEPTYPEPSRSVAAVRQGSGSPAFPSRALLKGGVICCTILVVILLTSLGAFALMKRFSHPHSEPEILTSGPFHPSPLSQQLQDFSEDVQNVRVFRFPFTTLHSREQRHPPVGGLGNFTRITSFDVCCESVVKEFVCLGGTTMAHAGPPLEAVLRQEEGNPSLYLLLWVNSDDFVEVGCWLTGFYLDSG